MLLQESSRPKNFQPKLLTAKEALAILDKKGSVFHVLHKIHESEPHDISVEFGSSANSWKRFLPIEDFKNNDLVKKRAKTFLSSGTTSTGLSKSSFSETGLCAYQNASLLTFLDVLKRFVDTPTNVKGYSLIPRTDQWPNSSLAYMIELFAAQLPVSYINVEDINQLTFTNTEPIWLFGTFAHFQLALQSKTPTPLPQGSVIFETGGLKKGQETLTRKELFSQLTAKFALPQSRQISEYSMCELASQAYDWQGNDGNYEDRCYRFPKWVDISSYQGLGVFARKGEGCLAISDKARLDIPSTIRTHDIVSLNGERFKLKSRVPSEVIKGCSNLVTPSNYKSDPDRKTGLVNVSKEPPISEKQFLKNFERLKEAVTQLFYSSATFDALEKEFSSLKIAHWAQKEVINAIKVKDRDLKETFRSLKDLESLKKWLVILPNNHSIAGIHPLIWGAALELQLFVRFPPALQSSLLDLVLDALSKPKGAKISRVANSFRVGKQPVDKFDAILAMGQGETISLINEKSPIPVQGFGSNLVAISCHVNHVQEMRERVFKSCFSLGQRGCFSSRALFIKGPMEPRNTKDLVTWLTRQSQSIFDRPLPITMRSALDIQFLKYSRTAEFMASRVVHEECLFPVLKGMHANSLPKVPFICPVIFYQTDSQLPQLAKGFDHIFNVKNIAKRQITWNGLHQGQYFYTISKLK